MHGYLVEFIGSVFFVYIILATGNPIAIGAALALVTLLTQPFSGGLVNPAVTIALVSANKIELHHLLPYCLAQIFGALVALELYKRFKI
jgi:glycerol uptake facilitator-like aquaporin